MCEMIRCSAVCVVTPGIYVPHPQEQEEANEGRRCKVAVGVFTPPLPEASRSETTFCFGVQLKLMENQIQIQESRTDGPHAQQEALLEGAEMQRTQALECLEKLTLELHEFVKSKVNIHKEIKTMTTSVTAALGRFKRMDEQWRSMKQRYLQVAPERAPASTSSSCVPLITISPSTEADMDMGSEADCESLAKETLDNRPSKRKQRISPESADKQLKRKKDSKSSPPQRKVPQALDENEKDKSLAWQKEATTRAAI
ncbi:hypothetical protein J6590_091415 [Homalodisca vitripennis]|nr:hypothetical protein J6590_091415 [Homalodisca vitripennis]